MAAVEKKRIALLGSTGSIGCQTLEVVRSHYDAFEVEVLTAQNNAELLIDQAIEFMPNSVVIGNTEKYFSVKKALESYPIKVFAGKESIKDIVTLAEIDIVLTAMLGISGLEPTLSAINAGKPIALANKETLVVAGNLITSIAREKGVNIYPVDSEHSAIFQCLAGEFHNDVEKIYLTASGGPFRGKKRQYLENVTKADALNHPNWNMGCKITIDSASLMNKGLEVIEAKWLFGLNADQIQVVIHPQSIIHSMVQFADGSIKAQMGLPDMKLPILYALSYPNRLATNFTRFNFADFPALTFETPDFENFPSLNLAYHALKNCGNMPCTLNAANEVAVAEFLKDKISFVKMATVVEQCMQKVAYIKNPGLDDLLATDMESRKIAHSLIS